jgi:hypothetical protein
MPGFVLHLGANVACTHQGLAMPQRVDPRVLVSGMPVVPMSGMWLVALCPIAPPPGGNGPCASGHWLTGSVRVRASQQPLLLTDSGSICTPTETPLMVRAAQTRVRAI